MTAPYTGGCLCGKARYVIDGEPITSYVCHCTDCQARTGSAFGFTLTVERGAVRLTQGETRAYAVTLSDGRIKTGCVCPSCGARLWGEPPKIPTVAVVQAGTLDDHSWLRPVAHIWTRSAQPWFRIPEGVARFEMAPPPGELVRLWKTRTQ